VEPGKSKGGEFKKAAMLQMAESVIAAMATVTSLAVGSFAPNGIARLIRMRIRAAFMIVLFWYHKLRIQREQPEQRKKTERGECGTISA
jgi:hypothetical protein